MSTNHVSYAAVPSPSGDISRLDCVGSPESLLYFLHDNRHRFKEIRSLALRYRFTFEEVPGSQWARQLAPYAEPTRIHPWRLLWNVLTHWYTGIEEITVRVSQEFWDLAPWRSGFRVCFETLNLCQEHLHKSHRSASREKRNFLEHTARLTSERIVKIEIDGAFESYDRLEFQLNLNEWAREQQTYRKWYATANSCSCPVACSLKESCFWRNDSWKEEDAEKTFQ